MVKRLTAPSEGSSSSSRRPSSSESCSACYKYNNFHRLIRTLDQIFEKGTTNAIGVVFVSSDASTSSDPSAIDMIPGIDISIYANKEVIISAGAFQSPQLLMVSGIGPRETLERHGIDVLVDLPGVGKGMEDHSESSDNLCSTSGSSSAPDIRGDAFISPTCLAGALVSFPAYPVSAQSSTARHTPSTSRLSPLSRETSLSRTSSCAISPCMGWARLRTRCAAWRAALRNTFRFDRPCEVGIRHDRLRTSQR